MTIRVEIAGKGMVAEFPDGTDPSVIDAAIKRDYFSGAASAPPAPEPSPMPAIEGASPWEVGSVPTPGEVAGPAIRHGLPAVAGIAGGMVPGAGVVTGPLAAITTDLALSKLYGERETPDSQRETSFLTDVALGVAPAGLGAAYRAASKLIPAPLESKIASTIRYGIQKGVRPTVAGKGNFPQAEQYYQKAQSAVESIIENKSVLRFTDEAGNAVMGKLPKDLNQFAQAIDQTKRGIFTKYDQMVRASGDLGRTVDLDSVVSELNAFKGNRINQMVGGGGITRADSLIESMAGQKLSLSETQDMVALLNGRMKAFYANPSPDLASSAAIDALTANRLRSALDSAVEKYGYQELKNQYGALRSIEKEVSNRAIVDARKNTKGLIDFSDIASAAEAARAVASMSAGPAAAAGAIKAMKEYYKRLNNPNRIVGKMFSEVDRLIATRGGAIPLKALPPGPRAMPGPPDGSYVRGVPAEVQVTSNLGDVIPGAAPSNAAEQLGRSVAERSALWQSANPGVSAMERAYLGYPYKEPLALPPKGVTTRSIEMLDDWYKKYSVRPQVR